MKARYYLFVLIVLFSIYSQSSSAQSYGLGFFSHEVVQDQRTSLDLSPGKTLCFDKNFELGFDLNFLPDRDDYFGYILRIVVGDKENIDLIYDNDLKERNHFKVIIGNKFSKIAYDINAKALYNNWNKIQISFNFNAKTLTLICGSYQQSVPIKLKNQDCFKILFGANKYRDFKTSDNPPMKIRNIHITENGDLKYNWPLYEYDGNMVSETVEGNNAVVDKPLWIKKMHYEWQKLGDFVVDGPASISFNSNTDEINVIDKDSLKTFSVKNTKLKAVSFRKRLTLLRGNYSLYEESKDRLLSFYTDQKIVSIYNSKAKTWSKDYNPNTPITDNWLPNKFYSNKDSSLYILGGYGHFVYKNQILKYHIPSNIWEEQHFTGDTFTPRYLAGLGKVNNGAYLIGGYGSTTGKQMLNPRNLYDLLFFDTDKKTIKKVYELKISNEDFVFANSLILNEKENTYYGLVFPRHKFDSELQLIVGSLKNPEYRLSGSKIPYKFHDINSYADLFYSSSSKRFIAVTTFRDNSDRTHINIFALDSPPLNAPDKIFTSNSAFWFWTAGISLMILLVIFYIFKKKRTVVKEVFQSLNDPELKITTSYSAPPSTKSSIFLFGELQVFDDDGNEITKQFTPLIKELFLVVLLYTVRWERGISSDKLKELLWFDKSVDSARNNRSVNIAKLKSILDKVSSCQISKETGYWRINTDPNITYIDYKEYVNLIKDKKSLSREKVNHLAAIIKRGAFLPTVNYEWMDSFKAEISNEIIDTLLHFAHSVDPGYDPEFLIEVSNYIFYFDSVNEDAMVIQCKALVQLGKHSLAKNTYENFCKEYKMLYNDDFEKSFSTVLISTPDS